MKILVTASASPLALALLPALAADERIEQIIGLDSEETTFRSPQFAQVLLDASSPQVARVLAHLDAVIHLTSAAALDIRNVPQENETSPNEHRLLATQNIFSSAFEQGVRCIVHLSSAAVYSIPPRERPITEQHPRAALPHFPWAEELVAAEDWLDTANLLEHESRVVRLRPALIVGRRASPTVENLLRGLFTIRLAGRPPKLNCVHIDDVARAILQALFRKDADGAFNLACANATTLAEMQRLRDRGFLPLPFPLIHRLHRLSQRMGRHTAPAWLEAFRHEGALDSNRARKRLGWKPQYDSVEACLRAEV